MLAGSTCSNKEFYLDKLREKLGVDLVKKVLIVVPGYCSLKAGVDVTRLTVDEMLDESLWALNEFQKRDHELPKVFGLIKIAGRLAYDMKNSMLCFSGGYTKLESGLQYSEGLSYFEIYKRLVQLSDIEGVDDGRVLIDESSYNSSQNLIGSISEFCFNFGGLPSYVIFVGYRFKMQRMYEVAEALGMGKRFDYLSCGNPFLSEEDLLREKAVCDLISKDPFTLNPENPDFIKTKKRNLFQKPEPALSAFSVQSCYSLYHDDINTLGVN